MQVKNTTHPQEVIDFVRYMTVSQNKAEKTASEYARDLVRFQRFLGDSPFVDATTDQINSFLFDLLTEGKNKPQSVKRKYAAIAAFFKYRSKKKMLGRENPCEGVDLPKCAKPLPKVMSETEVQCLLSARIQYDVRYAAYLEARDRAMMELLYGSGLRRFEACGLDLLDLDLAARKVRVRHGKGDKERYSYLSDPAIEAIKAYLEVRPARVRERSGSALFLTVRGDRITPRQLWCVFAKIREAAKAAGLEKHVVPHTMRHSFATHIYRRSRNIRAVQKLLGHSSINTTERYTHIDDSELQDIYEASHPRALAGGETRAIA